jgi:hypothetical protein
MAQQVRRLRDNWRLHARQAAQHSCASAVEAKAAIISVSQTFRNWIPHKGCQECEEEKIVFDAAIFASGTSPILRLEEAFELADAVGWRILRSAFASICRMRSRVTLNCGLPPQACDCSRPRGRSAARGLALAFGRVSRTSLILSLSRTMAAWSAGFPRLCPR